MSCFKFFFAGVFAVLAFLSWRLFNWKPDVSDFPKLNEDEWSGAEGSKDFSRNIVPFKVHVSDAELNYLKQRLEKFLSRPHTPPLANQGFQYGVNSDFLKQVVTYWKDDYNWKNRENYLNQYPQFKTKISGLNIHFLRVAPTEPHRKKVLPLLLLHGWPGSVREFYEVIPLFTNPQKSDFVFEIVAPSLPGFGFSDGARKPGLGPAEIAVIMKNLMTRLNFDKFYVAGGDWGAVIGKFMGQLYPENVLGLHSTMCLVNTPLSNLKWILGSIYPPLVVEDKFQNKMYPIKDVVTGLVGEMGYFLIQSTKPDTIGVTLSDTPVGLAAYILEKYSTWTNREFKKLADGGLTQKYSLDALLDNIMIYWITNSITTSQRLYFESFNSASMKLNRLPIEIPTACARFENELLWQPDHFLKEHYLDLIQVSDIKGGGHFAAFEEPKKFSQDVWSAISKMESRKKLNQ